MKISQNACMFRVFNWLQDGINILQCPDMTCYDRSIWQQSATLSLATNSSISRPVALTRRSVLDGAIPGICARRQNPLRKQPAKGAGGGDPEWECEYQTQGRALPLLLKKCLVGLVTDVAATRWIVSRRSLDSAEQGPESKQQSPGFLIPTATHIKPGWFSSHRSRPGPPLRPVPCFCRVLFGNIIHIALMYAF